MIDRITTPLKKYLTILLLSIFTIGLYAFVVESLFLVDLPIVKAVSTTSLPNDLLKEVISNKNNVKPGFGFYGKPVLLKIPRLSYSYSFTKLDSLDSLILNNKTLGLYTYGKPNSGRLGNSVIFTSSVSPILNPLNTVVPGERIIIDTEGSWRYSYKVENKTIVKRDSSYYFPDSGPNKIFIVKEIPLSNEVLVVEASYLSLEELGI
jgi:hypothetical protein